MRDKRETLPLLGEEREKRWRWKRSRSDTFALPTRRCAVLFVRWRRHEGSTQQNTVSRTWLSQSGEAFCSLKIMPPLAFLILFFFFSFLILFSSFGVLWRCRWTTRVCHSQIAGYSVRTRGPLCPFQALVAMLIFCILSFMFFIPPFSLLLPHFWRWTGESSYIGIRAFSLPLASVLQTYVAGDVWWITRIVTFSLVFKSGAIAVLKRFFTYLSDTQSIAGFFQVVVEKQEPCSHSYSQENLEDIFSRWRPTKKRYFLFDCRFGRLETKKKEAVEALRKQGFPEDRIEAEEFLHLRFEGTDTAVMIKKPEDGGRSPIRIMLVMVCWLPSAVFLQILLKHFLNDIRENSDSRWRIDGSSSMIFASEELVKGINAV